MAHDLRFGQFVCHGFFIFLCRLMRCGTQSSIQAICVPRISHFIFEMGEVWHTIFNSGGLCAKNFSFFFVD